MSQDQRISRLELSENARDVLASYCQALDTNDRELLASILHPDVVLQRPGEEPVNGHATVMKFFAAALDHHVESRRHFVTNQVVKVLDEKSAQVSSYLFALHHDKGELSLAWGDYRLEVVRGDSGVLIKTLVIDLDVPVTPVTSMLGDCADEYSRLKVALRHLRKVGEISQ